MFIRTQSFYSVVFPNFPVCCVVYQPVINWFHWISDDTYWKQEEKRGKCIDFKFLWFQPFSVSLWEIISRLSEANQIWFLVFKQNYCKGSGHYEPILLSSLILGFGSSAVKYINFHTYTHVSCLRWQIYQSLDTQPLGNYFSLWLLHGRAFTDASPTSRPPAFCLVDQVLMLSGIIFI